jgi:hypothetical protein
MFSNIVLILIAILIIAFMWLLWMRHTLAQQMSEARHRETILERDLQKRRDTVPYLLESFRLTNEPNEAWHTLMNKRAEFHQPGDWPIAKEWEFESTLLDFLRNNKIKNLSFLEAKKDIEDLTDLIVEKKGELQEAVDEYNERRNQFPYSMASAIFGFHSLSV